MECAQNLKLCHLCCSLSFLFFFILSSPQFRFTVEGRTAPKSDTLSPHLVEDDEKSLARGGHIGSSPPRCDRRCSSCGHCEAIQVPTNPSNNNSSTTVAYARGDQDSSNYKPMSWKCKCGKFIFDP